MTQLPDSALEWRRRVRVDRYATVFAHLLHFGPELTGEVLERFGLDRADWEAIDEAWSAELVEVTRRQQGELAMRFSSTFFRVRRELAKKQPALSSVGEPILRAPPPVAPSVPAAPMEMERPLLSYEIAERARAAREPLQPPPVPLERTAASALHASPAPTSAPVVAETSEVDLEAVRRGLKLPFVTKAPDERPDDIRSRLPLVRYAEIAASLGRGDDRAAILARHELTEATWSAIATAWSERLQREPELLTQFHAHVREIQGRR